MVHREALLLVRTRNDPHSVHPIAAIQSEYSLWTRNPEVAVLDECRRLGVAFVAFAPLSRGFLTGGVTDPARLNDEAAQAVSAFFHEGQSANTARTYKTALQYWGAWHALRYGRALWCAKPFGRMSACQPTICDMDRKSSSN
jgi:aryl-alcohol dehydrogenase-like predicted oxidoreductase